MITRAQMSRTLVVLADKLGKPLPNQAPTFDDVPLGSWYSSSVGQVQATGIMGAAEGNMFLPDTEVSKEEVIVAIV